MYSMSSRSVHAAGGHQKAGVGVAALVQSLDEHAVLPLAVKLAMAALDSDLLKAGAAWWAARLGWLSLKTRLVSLVEAMSF